ncbi:MAG: DUF3048 C-terminal domain-containing protein [Anaerolineales bacterium]
MGLVLLVALSACQDNPGPQPTLSSMLPTRAASSTVSVATSLPSPTPTESAPSPTPTAADQILNPLTGLPVHQPETLGLAPLLISVTEFPPSARPQAGLSLASQVWETSIGEGMSRFLAVYYGDYVDAFKKTFQAHPNQPGYAFAIGPIRSGRVGWETIKTFYPDGLLITRFASPEVAVQLTNLLTVYARDPKDVNSAGLTLSELEALAPPTIEPNSMMALPFGSTVPSGGNSGLDLKLIYNLYDQILWRYDPKTGRYLRSQDPGDGSGDLVPLVDRLTGETLGADNIVVLFANHTYENLAGTILKIRLLYLDRQPGLLLRDGRWYAIQWSTLKQNLMVQDQSGRPIALKPGQTYFEVVSRQSTWDPTDRVVRFHNPALPTLTPLPPITSTPTATETTQPTQTLTPSPTPTESPAP